MKILLFFFISLIFTACENKSDSSNSLIPLYSDDKPLLESIYIFGVHPLHNPKLLFDVYQPMIDLINDNLKGAKLRLEASRSYATFNEKLFSGYFDFALPNPYQTVEASKKGYSIFGKMGDDENFKGIILVRKDSKIKNVSDLKNKSISYPAPTALAATMLPQWFLQKNGIDINNDIKNIYVGSQESSIMSVYLGKTIAASTWPPPWESFKLNRPEIAKFLEIKWETKSLPNNGLVVKKTINKELLNKISNIIFNLHTHEKGRKILEGMHLSKYEKADDTTYNVVREFLKNFEKEIRPLRKSE